MKAEIDGRQLNMSPEHTDIKTIATRLTEGRTCFVELQPGDATRYQFYLIPQVGELCIPDRGLGDDLWSVSRYVWLAPINLSRGHLSGDIISLRSGGNIYWDLVDLYANDHTKMVITIFLDLVGQYIEVLSSVRQREIEGAAISGADIHAALQAVQPLNTFEHLRS